jgi:hypothetical protein
MRCGQNEKPIGINCDKLQFASQRRNSRKRQMKYGLRKSPSQRRWRNTTAVVTLIAAVAGPSAAVAQTGAPCAALAGRSIDPKLIGLASGAASVTSAAIERMPASPAAAEPSVAYCKVLGEIAPSDPAAPPIRFEINLPESWNRKAVQYGGGGFNGVLITGLDPLRDARLDTPAPVARGFATWGRIPVTTTRNCRRSRPSRSMTRRSRTSPLRPTRRYAMRLWKSRGCTTARRRGGSISTAAPRADAKA